MKAITFPNAPEFLEHTLTFLETDEVANSVILGIALRLQSRGEQQQNVFASVERNGKVVVAGLMTPPYNILLSHTSDMEAVERIAQLLRSHDVPIPGVVGPADVARRFVESWHQLVGASYRIRMNERLYSLRAVIPPLPIRGEFRLAEEGDADLLTEWTRAFNLEALQENTNPEDARANIMNRITFKELYVWDDGGPVTMAVRSRPTRHTQSISFVYTPPEKRGRGYASSCVAGLSQEILDMGYESALLFTDLSNPVSNRIYQKIGFRPVSDYDEYKFT